MKAQRTIKVQGWCDLCRAVAGGALECTDAEHRRQCRLAGCSHPPVHVLQEAPLPTLEVDADSVRVLDDGAVLWRARVLEAGRVEAGGQVLAGWSSMRPEVVARMVVSSWRRMARSHPSVTEVRAAWDRHVKARLAHDA